MAQSPPDSGHAEDRRTGRDDAAATRGCTPTRASPRRRLLLRPGDEGRRWGKRNGEEPGDEQRTLLELAAAPGAGSRAGRTPAPRGPNGGAHRTPALHRPRTTRPGSPRYAGAGGGDGLCRGRDGILRRVDPA